MQLKVEFSGNVTNVPEVKKIGAKETPLKELRVAINHDRKNKDSGEYEKTGDTTWVVVKLWGDRASEDFQKNDLVKYEGTLVEKHFGEDGKGRQLESDWIQTVEVVYRKDGAPAASVDDGFVPAGFGSGF